MSQNPPNDSRNSSALERYRIPTWLDVGASVGWRALVFVVALVILMWFLSQIQVLVIATLVGFMVAGLLQPLVVRLTSWGLPQNLAILVSFGVVVVVFGLLILVAVSWLLRDWQVVAQGIDQAIDAATLAIQKLRAPVPTNAADQVGGAFTAGTSALGGSVSSSLVQTASVFASIAIGMFMGLGLSLRLLRGGGTMWLDLITRVSPGERELFDRVGRLGIAALGASVWGQTIIALVNAAITTGGLLLIGVPGAVGLAPFVFFLSFIPYYGVLVYGALVVLVAYGEGGGGMAVAALVLMFIVRSIERYVMLPRLVGRRVNLSPVEVLYTILLAYYLLGLIGAFLALPLAAMFKVMVTEIRDARRIAAASRDAADWEATPPGDEVGLGTV
jgi:predicted PurR-regulated permease PerM